MGDGGFGRVANLGFQRRSELAGPARRIARFGTAEQVAAAVTVVRATTASRYRILADGASEPPAD